MKVPYLGFHETMSGYYWNPMDPRLASKCCCSEGSCCSKKGLEEMRPVSRIELEKVFEAMEPIMPRSDYPLIHIIAKHLLQEEQENNGNSSEQFIKEFGKKFEFTVTAEAPLHKLANPKSKDFMLTKLRGVVTMEDVVENCQIQDGELLLDFFGAQELVYSFNFDVDGKTFYYEGQKELSLKHPLYSMTTLGGGIYERENDEHVGHYFSECKFDLNNLPKFLFSFLQGLKVK